jgi:hypothetical protein
MESKTDFFFLVILVIVASSFIGLNIVSIIDKKIKNLSINMPKITVPPAEVTVNIENDDNKYKISCTSKKKNKKVKKKKKKNKIPSDMISKKPGAFWSDGFNFEEYE